MITVSYINSLWTAQWAVGKTKPKPLRDILDRLYKSINKMTDLQMLERVKAINSALGD